MHQEDLAGCLHAWRDRLSPAAVGLPSQALRRAPGLRREELAQLSGLSVDYLTRLEQGRTRHRSRFGPRAPKPSSTRRSGESHSTATSSRAHGSDVRIVVYTPRPGSPDADALALIGVIGLQSMAV